MKGTAFFSERLRGDEFGFEERRALEGCTRCDSACGCKGDQGAQCVGCTGRGGGRVCCVDGRASKEWAAQGLLSMDMHLFLKELWAAESGVCLAEQDWTLVLKWTTCRRCSALRRAIRGTMRQPEHAESVPPGAAHGVRTAGGLVTDRRAGRKGADPYTREEGVSGYRLGNIAHCERGSEVDGVLF